MSVSKIKNLILLILALAIIGLLPAVVPTQAARVGSEKKVHEKLEALYESYGLSLDASSLPASQTLYSIELENPDAKPAAQALLGGKAAESLTASLKEAGSTAGVDAVTGSTMTSDAVFAAMDDCLAQAAQ